MLGLQGLIETELGLCLGPQASVPALFAVLPTILLCPSRNQMKVMQ